MDMHVCYWDNNHNYEATRYYHSEFLGITSGKDVLESLSACLSGISKSKLLHVSCDGPSINLSFLDLLEEDGNEKELSQLVQIGTYDLHTLHSFMEDGQKASDWNVKKLLTSLDRISEYPQTTHYSSVQIVVSKTRG